MEFERDINRTVIMQQNNFANLARLASFADILI